MLGLFQSYLGAETKPRVGAQHMLNAEYFKRIDALNYTMLHDDGQHADDLEEADVVLVGVSRTSKTPTSIYLANRGVKTANVPLVPGMPLPPQLETLHAAAGGRPDRQPGAHRADPPEPAARPATPITTPISTSTGRRWPRRSPFSRKLCGKHNWPIIDVTRRSIEETAAAVMTLLAERRRQPANVSRCRCGSPRSRWCSPRKARCAARCWKPPAFRSRSAGRRSTSARSKRARGLRDAAAVAALLAREKARAVAAKHPGRLVLGADQTLALGEQRFSKPADRAGAREQLAALRGQTHELHSAVAVVRGRRSAVRACRRRAADHARRSPTAFSTPISTRRATAATASVGGYQLEGVGIHLFERIEGDHFTILGLPLLPLLGLLRRSGHLAK